MLTFTATELEEILLDCLEDKHFDMPFMGGPLTEPAQQFATLQRVEQDLLINCINRVAAINEVIAYEFVLNAVPALSRLGEQGVKNWIVYFMDIYDTSGIAITLKAVKNIEKYEKFLYIQQYGIFLSEVELVLTRFVNGLSGRTLLCNEGTEIHTDSETLYLPNALDIFATKEENFHLYKAIVAHLWALTRYGSFTVDLKFADFADQDKAINCFHSLETLRLNACIARDLPGLHREMQALQPIPQLSETWQQCHEKLKLTTASVQDSLSLLEQVYPHPLPEKYCYQGILVPDKVIEIRQQRLQKEQQNLIKLLTELKRQPLQQLFTKKTKFTAEVQQQQVQLSINEQPIFAPPDLQHTLNSIAQDLGHIPPEWLEAAGEGNYDSKRIGNQEEESNNGTYDEWNYRRLSYHKNWCTLREVAITPQDDDFVQQTLIKYRPLIHHLRRSFEIFRSGEKRLKRQLYGDDIDIDNLISAFTDAASGLEMSQHVFTRIRKIDRDVVVIFLVDMSGSTKGWINRAERESLILLCEALETLGDRYGIYGFSGMTRTKCEIYPIKTIEDSYDDKVKHRISGISAKDYTRMGVAIRYANRLLSKVEAKTRLLITLSDGKPDDFDNYYRGQYGIEDTRQALIESKRQGIHPFCITLDKEGPDYLPHLYGPVNYTVVDKVHKLPLKVADIYRVLTTN